MNTLKELIAEGLPVGVLVASKTGAILQLHPNNAWYAPTKKRYIQKESVFYSVTTWQPTTAYDSDIDPEKLPIEEPFWTGWFVLDRIKREITKIEPCGDGFDLYFYDNSIVYSSICQPCLPPA